MDRFQGTVWNSVETGQNCLSETYVSITLCTLLAYFRFIWLDPPHF